MSFCDLFYYFVLLDIVLCYIVLFCVVLYCVVICNVVLFGTDRRSFYLYQIFDVL